MEDYNSSKKFDDIDRNANEVANLAYINAKNTYESGSYLLKRMEDLIKNKISNLSLDTPLSDFVVLFQEDSELKDVFESFAKFSEIEGQNIDYNWILKEFIDFLNFKIRELREIVNFDSKSNDTTQDYYSDSNLDYLNDELKWEVEKVKQEADLAKNIVLGISDYIKKYPNIADERMPLDEFADLINGRDGEFDPVLRDRINMFIDKNDARVNLSKPLSAFLELVSKVWQENMELVDTWPKKKTNL